MAYWIPVQYVGFGGGGAVGMYHAALDRVKATWKGGSADEQKWIRLVKIELVNLTKTYNDDVKSGAHVPKLMHLISSLESLENAHALAAHEPIPFPVVNNGYQPHPTAPRYGN